MSKAYASVQQELGIPSHNDHLKTQSSIGVATQQIAPQLIDVVDYELYEKREHIHTRAFKGFYRNLRLAFGSVLFLLYFGAAWLNWNGRQAVLFNMADREFHIFGATFWAQDFYLLGFLLIICAFGLFFITNLAGRVWCGYACPQSVWTWLFMWAEKITEGDRNQRIKLDQSGWNIEKLSRRFSKHGLWLFFGFITGFTFVGYFYPIREMFADLTVLELSGWALFWVLSFTLATYVNAGWLREQVCLHMCPYSRFQSSMFDADTLIISYDEKRGEGRGPRKKGANYRSQGLGDCIDCTMCVQVCPTGIDIRDGLQIDCIGCAACIDACDTVMEKMGYNKGLIRYTSENLLKGIQSKILRPSLVAYAAVLLLMIVSFGYGVADRSLVELNSVRDRNQIFSITSAGLVENVYTLQVGNKDQVPHDYRLRVEGLESAKLLGSTQMTVLPGEVINLPIRIQMKQKNVASSSLPLEFIVQSTDKEEVVAIKESRFISPSKLVVR